MCNFPDSCLKGNALPWTSPHRWEAGLLEHTGNHVLRTAEPPAHLDHWMTLGSSAYPTLDHNLAHHMRTKKGMCLQALPELWGLSITAAYPLP